MNNSDTNIQTPSNQALYNHAIRLINESNKAPNMATENHEIDFDNVYKFKQSGLIVLNAAGVDRVKAVYVETKNERHKMIEAAKAVNISTNTLRRMLINVDHPNHNDLVSTLKAPRRRLLSEEYRAYVAPIAKNLAMFKEVLGKKAMSRSVQYLREINFLSPKGLRARDCDYTTVSGMIKHYLLVHDFETPEIEVEPVTKVEPVAESNIDILRQLLESAKKAENSFPFIDCALDILDEAKD